MRRQYWVIKREVDSVPLAVSAPFELLIPSLVEQMLWFMDFMADKKNVIIEQEVRMADE